MENKYYLTTPIYYINDVPHIGHAYTTIAADVLARHYKKEKKEVFFLTGTDEHGAKIAKAAEKAGKKPAEFVDELVPKFQSTWQNLNIQYSEFFRTTNSEHEKLVQDFVEKLAAKNFVEKRKYKGFYCVACENYYKKSELVDNKCPIHKTEVEIQEEENYFFLLSKFADKLIEKIESGELQIAPEARKNEVLSKIKMGLEDVSISRSSVSWGVQFPNDPSQTIYVWVDALLNYYTATKIYKKEALWPADLHLMAKDILWFHAVIWPAMLLASDLPLPKKIFAHGFFTVGGEKMSKTTGNVLDPNILVEKFGADVVRYALLREFPFGEDGDISKEKIAMRYEKELANGIGNLLQRTLNMINLYNIKVVKPSSDIFGTTIKEKIEKFDFFEALNSIKIMAIDVGNVTIDKVKPWDLVKNNKIDEATAHLNELYRILYSISWNIAPFMPQTAEKMKKQLETLKPEPLFPRHI